MKQKTEKQTRQNKPRKRRFSGFLLRRLIPCLLAGCTVCAIRIRSAYKYWDNFEFNARDKWDQRVKRFFEEQIDDETPPLAERLLEKDGVQGVVCGLSDINDPLTGHFAPFRDISVMLLRPDTGEITISEPSAGIVSESTDENGEYVFRRYDLSPEESERIAEDIRAYMQQHYFRFYFTSEFSMSLLTLIEPLSDLVSRFHPHLYAAAAYADNESCTAAEYGWRDEHDLLQDVKCSAEAPAEGRRILTNRDISNEGGLYRYDSSHWNEKPPAGTEIISAFGIEGYPADCHSGSLMRNAADNTAAEIRLFQQEIADLQEIIDDPTGTKRQKYYNDQFKIIVAQMKAEDEVRQDGQTDFSGVEANVPTPEERLQELYRTIGRLPAYHTQIPMHYSDASPFAVTKTGFQYFTDTRTVTLQGVTYTLYCIQSVDVKNTLQPCVLIESFQTMLAAFLLALLWASAAYLRTRRKYEMDEYRRSLTAALAHDLKSPLTAISGYAENLGSGVRPEKQQHYAASILENTQYMDKIITNVLELSRLEQHTVTRKKWVELTTLMKEQLSYRQDEISERELNVQITGACFFYADPQMMMQAVRNLLDNAFKYTPDGGSITVTGEDRSLRIVNDIKEEKIEHLDRLCEAFVKGDSARSNRMGTGLGLSVVRQAAALNKLRFGIESSGHTFTVLLSDKPKLFRRIMPRRKTSKQA